MKSPGHPRMLRAFVSLIALLFVASATTCGQNGTIVSPEITVIVDVAGLTSDITSLFVTPSLTGGQPQTGQEVTSNLSQFALALPTTTTGTLTINVVGRSAEHCVVSTGSVMIDISAPPTRYEVTVTLAPPANGAAKSCTLTVAVQGKGSVTSTPPGISCTSTTSGLPATSCTYDFPVGSNITLSSTLDPKSYGAAFNGLCTGSGSCSFAYSGPGTVQVAFAARACSRDNWCWYNPLPTGNILRGLWGSSASDVWAVGDAGTILHFDGATWSAATPISAVTPADLYAVYGTGASDVWAVGSAGVLLHFDGTAWSLSQDSGVKANGTTLRSVWGSGPKDYYAVGYSGLILHYDGTGWSQAAGSGQVVSTNPLYALWGSGPSDIWAVGPSGIIIHSSGGAWTLDANSGKATTNALFAISGTGPSDVIALGTGGTTIRFSGSWALDNSVGVNGLNAAYGVFESAPGSAVTVGITNTGTGAASRLSAGSWQPGTPNVPFALNAVWGASASNVWAVGAYGILLHFDGTSWSTAPLAVLPTLPTLESVWGNAANDVWAAGLGGNLRHFDGTTWSPVASGVTNDLYSIWGTNAGNVFAVGAAGTIIHYDVTVGTTFKPVVSPTVNQLNAINGSSSTSVYFVGNGATVVNWNGTTAGLVSLAPLSITSNLTGVWVPNTFSVSAFGDSGTAITRSLFSGWSNYAMPAAFAATFWRGLWGINTPTTKSFAVGNQGAIAAYDGTTGIWSQTPTVGTPGVNNLTRVWGFNATSAWATASANAIYHFDGTSWTQQIPGKPNYGGGLLGVYVASPTDAWAVGDFGAILRYMP